MSFDLDIVTSQKPRSEDVEDFLSSHQGFNAKRSLSSEVGNVLVTRDTEANQHHPSFTIDGPFQVEIDDLDTQVIASVLDPRWLTQISAPSAASPKDLKIAKELARYIADVCQGSVYDPQLDKVIWPKQSRRRYVATVKEERIRLVSLDWFLPVSQSGSETAKVLLHLLRKICPEAVPTRFGTFEPLQHRLGSNDDEPFIELWKELSGVQWGDSFFWRAKSPCFGGHLSFPDQRDQYKPERAERALHLSMDFDGRALRADARWCETTVRLFSEVAESLRAFYAVGYVQRNVIAGRSIWFDGKSESVTLSGRWWLGLPPTPAWLAWFGAGYAQELRDHLSSVASTIKQDGIFLRLGAQPMDCDELKGVFPRSPDSLLAEQEGENHKPARKIPRLE